MTILRDMFANELPTAIYFCGTAVMLAIYALCALSLRRPAPVLAPRRQTRARP
jgi:hypothetical protein